MNDLHWKTAITKVEPNMVAIRGYRVDQLMGRISFSQVIYLVLSGNLPSDREGKLLDAILVSSVDHGATPPSALAARTVASAGAPLTTAMAAGISAISKTHGGAIEASMRVFNESVSRMKKEGKSVEEMATQIVVEQRAANRRIPGYGHRIHAEDPRSVKLFALASELGLSGEHVIMAQAIESAIEETLGKRLPLNVDGAIAALLCELNFPPEMANGFFAISRLPGLMAHVYEEMTRERPMRRIHPTDHEYDGPDEKSLEEV